MHTADALALTFAFKVNAKRQKDEEEEEFPGMFPNRYQRGPDSWMA